MDKNIFRVALLQKCSKGRDYKWNARMIIDAMGEAKKEEADILLLPECFITGYELPYEIKH